MNKIILGIDPGKTGAYCYVRDGKVLRAGSVNTQSYESIIGMVGYIHELDTPIIAYIEDVYVHLNKKNYATILKHAKGIGYTVGHLEAIGVKCRIAHPKTWQSEILVLNGAQSKDTKTASIQIARSCGIDTKNDNISDAVCIAMYGYNHERLLDAVRN